MSKSFKLKEYHDTTLGNAQYCALQRGAHVGDEQAAHEDAHAYANDAVEHINGLVGWCEYTTAVKYAPECDVHRDDYSDVSEWCQGVLYRYAYNHAMTFLTEQN